MGKTLEYSPECCGSGPRAQVATLAVERSRGGSSTVGADLATGRADGRGI